MLAGSQDENSQIADHALAAAALEPVRGLGGHAAAGLGAEVLRQAERVARRVRGVP